MPQIELKYSSDLTLDAVAIFKKIEATINNLDTSAGSCKCRAYPADEHLHAHIVIEVALLQKPHRDQTFMKNCLAALERAVLPLLPRDTYYAIEVFFSGDYYLTKKSPL